MKYTYILLILILSVFGCKNSNKENQQIQTESKKKTNNSKVNFENVHEKKSKAIQRPNDSIINLYSGFWINNDFLEQVNSKKSIYESREFKGSLFGFSLESNELKKGITNLNGFSVHEGGLGVPIKWIDKFSCFSSRDQIQEDSSIQISMDVVIIKKDLIEFQFEDSHSEYYKKVVNDYNELRKILFEGNYEDNSGKSYEFQSNGNLTGFKDKKYYTLLYDFVEGLNLDVIFISDNKKRENEKLYHYKFNEESLKIYEINGEVPEFEIGELKYVLYKK